MSRGKLFTVACILLLLNLCLSACATRASRNGRHGLFDRNKRDSGKMITGEASDEVIQLTGKWQWPLKNVSVSSPYGERGRKFHQGVDLRAPMRTKVLAANEGTVVYVGTKIRGYGRMVVLKHEDNFYTVYAHHSKNLVKVGKRVKRGEVIAYSGKSGHAHGPHLHFEIRKGTQSYDPVYAINENIQRFDVNRSVASKLPPTAPTSQ